MPFSLTPDWGTDSIVIVWPEGLPRKAALVPLFTHLVFNVFKNIPVTIIVKDRAKCPVLDTLIDEHPHLSLIQHKEITDIWIRDWMPAYGLVSSKAMYKPSYMHKYPKEAHLHNLAGSSIAQQLIGDFSLLPLIWDMGNLTHNGDGKAVITKRILADNPEFSENDIRTMLMEELGLDTIAFVDEEYGDVTGHIDGTMRFIDERTIAVGMYPDCCIEENRSVERMIAQVNAQFNDDITFVLVAQGKPSSGMSDGIGSAFGNHINFARVRNEIFMPFYGIPEDIMAVDALAKALPDVEIIPVVHELMGMLSDLGGVLHCMTWEMEKED